MTPEIENCVRESFARQTMMQTLGARIERIAAGEVELRAPILPTVRQQQGAAHAGLAFSIGDSAAGYAALTLMPEGTDVVTAEIKVNLTGLAHGDYLLARGKVVQPGRRLIVVSAEVFAHDGDSVRLVALMQGTMVPVYAFFARRGGQNRLAGLAISACVPNFRPWREIFSEP